MLSITLRLHKLFHIQNHSPKATCFVVVVEAVPTSMSYQYTSNRNMGFGHRLCCYDNNNGMYLTSILKHFACV